MIKGLIECNDVPKPDAIKYLRYLIDLPTDDAEAVKFVRDHYGSWEWNPKTSKYCVGSGKKKEVSEGTPATQ